MTIIPDAHGGNMDTPELRAGVTVYFGVNVAGRAVRARRRALPGRAHGEVCGTAVEAAMNTVVVVDADQGRRPRRGRGWRPTTALMSTGSARPLEDAYRISQHDLVTWAAELTGLDDARRLPAGQPGR